MLPIDQPMMQLAMLLLSLSFLWWVVRSIRRKVALHRENRQMILTGHLKMLSSSALVGILSALLLMASAGLISSRAAHHAAGGAILLWLCAVLYLIVCNAPRWVWRWLDPS
jgi:hypothetical protein